jgi:hypothetical protein
VPVSRAKRRGPKTAKPSFNVAPVAFEQARTGWVYRSEEAPAPAEPADPAWTVSLRLPPAPVEVRSFTRPEPSSPRGWIESGFYVMALPMAITVGMMLAPVIWMLGSRSRD